MKIKVIQSGIKNKSLSGLRYHIEFEGNRLASAEKQANVTFLLTKSLEEGSIPLTVPISKAVGPE